MRVKLLWRPSARAWVSWGRAAVVSVGAQKLQTSRQYSLGVGPMLLWLIVPMSARERQRQMDLARPNLRRVAKRLDAQSTRRRRAKAVPFKQ
jgi:hypothetical protein